MNKKKRYKGVENVLVLGAGRIDYHNQLQSGGIWAAEASEAHGAPRTQMASDAF